METTKNQNAETPKPASAAPRSTSGGLREALALPEGDVLVRKVGGPDGTHSWVGYCKVDRVYCVGIRHAVGMIDGGEFEALSDYAADVEAERKKNAKV